MESVWHEAQSQIKKMLTPQTFVTWIKPIRFAGFENGSLYLEVPNKFFKEWIDERYLYTIQEAVSVIAQTPVKIQFRINSQDDADSAQDPAAGKTLVQPAGKTDVPAEESAPSAVHTTNLNSKYTFDTFVCGSSNQFAYAASQAVANKPASDYNPLFIYGGVGLGKTHLLTAIGNHIAGGNKKAKICLYSSEKFMNEMINCIRHKKMDEFRNKFRKMDVLLIDDIQFMAGKEATQEEFFHTFNSLYESHKQIVVASDKYPKEIPGLEDRLRSRFEWGLIADIQPPDTETKIAIMKKKADQQGIRLPDDVALFLASSATSNIRELEGMLIRLEAVSSLQGKEISLGLARDVLKDIIVDKSRYITIETIQKQVADYFKLKIADLKSDKRLKILVIPRQIAIYLCRELTKASFPEIGEKFGGKDHSTIIYSVKKLEERLTSDHEVKNALEDIKRQLLN
jgi:chromosomal replication initiator protein